MNSTRNERERPLDAIVVGTGAGGSAAAARLAESGLEVLIVEKGRHLQRDGRTQDVDRVVNQGEFKSREVWLNAARGTIVPEEYFNVGGKTKWYGAALLRFAPEEFSADPDHQCIGWPIGYEDLVPYYEQAEAVLGTHTFDTEPHLAAMIRSVQRHDDDWEHKPLQMGLRSEILRYPGEARHFDGFASTEGLKADAEVTFLAGIDGRPNVRMVTGCAVEALLSDPARPSTITGVRLSDGRIVRAKYVVLAAGALHSPRLLQRHLEAHALTGLPAAASVGRNLKLHLLTAVLAVTTRPQLDLLRKTSLLVHPDVPHSSVQPLGFDGDLLANLIPAYVPRLLARAIGARAYGFFLQTEDGSHSGNRVIGAGCSDNPSASQPLIDFDSTRVGPARSEHARLVRRFRRALLRAGYPNFAQTIGLHGTAHACGTLVTGSDPYRSVVDASGKVHGLEGLYISDGSVLPRVSRVNPALTIYAWGLRMADQLIAEHGRMATSIRQTERTPS